MNKAPFLSYQQPFSIKMSTFGFKLIARDLLWWIIWLSQGGESWVNKRPREICNYSLRQSCTLYVPQKSIRRTGCQLLTSHWRQFSKNFTHSFPWSAPNFPFPLPFWPFAFLRSVFHGSPDLLGPDVLRITFSGMFSITKTFSPLPVTLGGSPSG